MAAATSFLCEEQFRCCICLDVFTDPVTIPCGHNFCKTCITQHWNINVLYHCPMCKEPFVRRPDVRVNTFISEMVNQFRQSVKKTSSCSDQSATKAGEVLCDVCTETKMKAVKSCLVCLTSYCDTHLEPHLRITGLRRHRLINPVKNLEDRMCKKHDKPLEQFCKTDQMYVCLFCTEFDHRRHNVVSLEKECEQKKAMLETESAKIQQMIQMRQQKIDELKQSVRISKDDAERETAAGVQLFTTLIDYIESGLAEFIHAIEEKQKTREKQAEDFIRELEEEISELLKKSSEVEHLAHTEDHLQLLQNFPSLNPIPPSKDWTEVKVCTSYAGMVGRAVAQLEEMLSREMEKQFEDELKRVQQFAVDVTVDRETAHPILIVSDDRKEVSRGDVIQNVSDNPERFYGDMCVLGKESFSSGRFYYEVQVRGKTGWEIGVVTQSVTRSAYVPSSPKNGYWTLNYTNGNKYRALTSPAIPLSLKVKPEKVGVFVDYEEGLISFYDTEAPTLIYTFIGCNFTEKLYPYFNPYSNKAGVNSAPLVICPVNDMDK